MRAMIFVGLVLSLGTATAAGQSPGEMVGGALGHSLAVQTDRPTVSVVGEGRITVPAGAARFEVVLTTTPAPDANAGEQLRAQVVAVEEAVERVDGAAVDFDSAVPIGGGRLQRRGTVRTDSVAEARQLRTRLRELGVEQAGPAQADAADLAAAESEARAAALTDARQQAEQAVAVLGGALRVPFRVAVSVRQGEVMTSDGNVILHATAHVTYEVAATPPAVPADD